MCTFVYSYFRVAMLKNYYTPSDGLHLLHGLTCHSILTLIVRSKESKRVLHSIAKHNINY